MRDRWLQYHTRSWQLESLHSLFALCFLVSWRINWRYCKLNSWCMLMLLVSILTVTLQALIMSEINMTMLWSNKFPNISNKSKFSLKFRLGGIIDSYSWLQHYINQNRKAGLWLPNHRLRDWVLCMSCISHISLLSYQGASILHTVGWAPRPTRNWQLELQTNALTLTEVLSRACCGKYSCGSCSGELLHISDVRADDWAAMINMKWAPMFLLYALDVTQYP